MPSDPKATRPPSECLIGTWELLTREDRTSSGERSVDPGLGEDPVALLIYDGGGHFAAQFMRRERALVPDTKSTVAVPNNSRARGGYDAYCGTYSIDDANSTVTQCFIGALSPEKIGLVVTRRMKVVGDELVIRLDTATCDAVPITRTLKWKRVG